tara:strand:+ start:280 stop:480 length:201 start_codon:yes stop_codon:yes gene_type:complete
MAPNYKLLFEEAMALNAHLEEALDSSEEYAQGLFAELYELMNETESNDIATWGIGENGDIVNMLTQ